MYLLTRKSLREKSSGPAMQLFQLLPRFIIIGVTCRQILKYVVTMTAVSDLVGLVTSLNLSIKRGRSGRPYNNGGVDARTHSWGLETHS